MHVVVRKGIHPFDSATGPGGNVNQPLFIEAYPAGKRQRNGDRSLCNRLNPDSGMKNFVSIQMYNDFFRGPMFLMMLHTFTGSLFPATGCQQQGTRHCNRMNKEL
jgi:hypothetical protein